MSIFAARVQQAQQAILAGGLLSAEASATQRRERLIGLLSHHYYNAHNDTYRRMLGEHGLNWGEPHRAQRRLFGRQAPEAQQVPVAPTLPLADLLQQLPITDRSLLLAGNYAEHPAVPAAEVAFTPVSSGTTSQQAVSMAVSQQALWAGNCNMILAMLMMYGLDPLHSRGYMVANFKRGVEVPQPWTTYAVFKVLSEASDGQVVLGSIQDTLDQHFAEMLRAPTQWVCTSPVFYNQLIARAGERDLRQLGLQVLLWGGSAQRPAEHEQVMQAFGARHSVGFYVSTESNIAAFQMGDRLPYALLTDFQIMEIVDAQGRHVAPGETGEILITCLDQDATPIIRYRVGDQARYLGQPAADSQVWQDLGIALPPPSWTPGGHIATGLVPHATFFDQVTRAGGLVIGAGKVTYDEVAAIQQDLAKRGTPVAALQLAKRLSAAGQSEIVLRIETTADAAATRANAQAALALAPQLDVLAHAGEVMPPTIEIFTPGTLGQGKFKIPPIIDETLDKTKAGLSIN